VMNNLQDLTHISQMDLNHAVTVAGTIIVDSCFWLSLGLVLVALVDVPLQRHQLNKKLKMTKQEVSRLLLAHLDEHYALYGERTGVRSARKHIAWYIRSLPGGEAFRQHMNTLEDSASQHRAVAAFFDDLAERHERLPDPVLLEEPLALHE